MRSILAAIVALSLAACNTAGLNVPTDTVAAVKKDVQLACDLRDMLNAPTFSVSQAADVVCLLAQNGPKPAGFDERNVTGYCAELEYHREAKEWQAVCLPRLSGDVENILRSMTAAEGYFQTIYPDYRIPDTVLFSGTTLSPCGIIALAAYCPADLLVYIDPEAIKEYSKTSEVRAAYITWHEIAHHVSDVYGGRLFNYGMDADSGNAYTRSVELEADCWAGAVAKFVGATESQAMEGLRMARLIGGSAEGTHGSGVMRAEAVTLGYKTGECAEWEAPSAASIAATEFITR